MVQPRRPSTPSAFSPSSPSSSRRKKRGQNYSRWKGPENNSNSNTETRPLQGQLRGGTWFCDCSPRLPALQLTVRRETENKGRSFYTCQKDKDKDNKCGFFLWSEDARKREIGAVLSNSRSESGKKASGAGADGTPSKPKQLRQTTLHASITPRTDRQGVRNAETPISRLADIDFGGGGGGAQSPSKGASSTTATSSTVRASDSAPQAAPQPPPSSSSSRSVVAKREFVDLFSDSEDDELVHLADGTGRLQPQPQPQPQVPRTAISTATATAATSMAGSKRKRPLIEEEEEEEEAQYDDLSSGEEEELMSIADNSAKKQQQQKHQTALETPAVAAGRTHDVEAGSSMPTPLTERPVRRVLFADQIEADSGGGGGAAKRSRLDEAGNSAHHHQQHQHRPITPPAPAPEPATPSTATTATMVATPSTSSSNNGVGVGNVTQEVMELLRGQPVPEPVLRGVRAALERHVAKARGLERGRDVSRQVARRAEARIAELQARVADLENSRRMDVSSAAAARAGSAAGSPGGRRRPGLHLARGL